MRSWHLSKYLKEGERPLQAEWTASAELSGYSMPGVFKEQYGGQYAWNSEQDGERKMISARSQRPEHTEPISYWKDFVFREPLGFFEYRSDMI